MGEPNYEAESWDIWHDGRDIYHIDVMTDEVDGEGIKTMIADNVIGKGRAKLMARAPGMADEIERLKAINAELLAACNDGVEGLRKLQSLQQRLRDKIAKPDAPVTLIIRTMDDAIAGAEGRQP